ncbi:hypothetical protein WL77_02925 [Burkholderia ubonensis]|nr:hypothetical protein WL77_02925 [Burkholderia ubonensis]KWE67437.1 hypothetical protein WL79_26545 [Burkholderia ubonensis]
MFSRDLLDNFFSEHHVITLKDKNVLVWLCYWVDTQCAPNVETYCWSNIEQVRRILTLLSCERAVWVREYGTYDLCGSLMVFRASELVA